MANGTRVEHSRTDSRQIERADVSLINHGRRELVYAFRSNFAKKVSLSLSLSLSLSGDGDGDYE